METEPERGASGAQRRRALVADSPLQRRFMRRVVLAPALCVIALSALMVVLAVRLLGEARVVETDLPSLVPFVVVAFFTIVLGGLVLCWQALRHGNAIVGPVPRLVAAVRTACEGHYPELARRPDDELRELIDELDRLFATLREQQAAAQAEASSEAHVAVGAGAGEGATR